MPTVVLKLFARQGTGRTDGQSGDYSKTPLIGPSLWSEEKCSL